MLTTLWIAVLWLASGFLFWCGTIRYHISNTGSTPWKSGPRCEGRDTLICWYLPLSLVMGPIAWAIMLT